MRNRPHSPRSAGGRPVDELKESPSRPPIDTHRDGERGLIEAWDGRTADHVAISGQFEP